MSDISNPGLPGQGGEEHSQTPITPSGTDSSQPEHFGLDKATLEMANVPTPNPDDPKKPKKDKKLEEIQDIPPELEPYRQELMEWVGTEDNPKPIYRTLVSFLQYQDVKFKLIGGKGFYFAPSEGVISLSVPFYKEMKDKFGNEMSPIQFLFGAMHEFAHLKTMIELNEAGLHNLLKQFDYTSQKGYFIDTPDGPVRMTAGETYDHFYNILEDAMVNQMVFNTIFYGENFAEGRQNREQVTNLYTEKFFPIKLTPEQYAQVMIHNLRNPDNPISQPTDFIAKKEHYAAGFDWNQTATPMNRTGQFSTFFIKNQMGVLEASSVFDPTKNPEGKHILHEDVGMIFTRPLTEVYETLLKRVIGKYRSDPAKYINYLRFMTEIVRVPVYGVKNGKVKRVKNDDVYNVMNPGRVDGNGNVDYTLATFEYSRGAIKPVLDKLGSKTHPASITFLDLFNNFKQLDWRRQTGGTVPFIFSLQERIEAYRHILEPIFSLLCVLDDSFTPEMPQGDDSPPKPQKPPEWPKDNNWRPGDWVKNDVPGSPNRGKRGRIVRINGDPENPDSIVVVYDKDQSHLDKKEAVDPDDGEETLGLVTRIQGMADSLPSGGNSYLNNFSGETETVFDPNRNLVLLHKEGKSQKGSQPPTEKEKDFRRKEIVKKEKPENEPDDEDNDEDDDDGDEDLDDTFENEDESDNKDKKGKPKPGGKQNKPGEPEDQDEGGEGSEEGDKDKDKSGGEDKEPKPNEGEGEDGEDHNEQVAQGSKKGLSRYRGFVERLLREDRRNRRNKEIEAELGSKGFKEKTRDLAEEERVIKKLAEARRKLGLETPEGIEEIDRQLIHEYRELEEELGPKANKMAYAWLNVIKNITSRIKTIREKYFMSGKVDMKRLQRFYLEIMEGMDVENKMIYSRLVEKLVTELRPKAIRVILNVDNSSSMGDKLQRIRMAVMLLNRSLRSFKELFKTEISSLYRSFGAEPPSARDLDIVVDIEIRLFGSGTTLAAPFSIDDYSFLVDKKQPMPVIDPDNELISTMLAFQAISTNESTYDRASWERIIIGHDEKTQLLINEGVISEVVIQITDGQIQEGGYFDEKVREAINQFYRAIVGEELTGSDNEVSAKLIKFIQERMNIGVAGFAIGKDKAEAETAFKALAERMEEDKVIPANSIDEIVDNFSELLRNVIMQRFEDQMMRELDEIEKKLQVL